MNFAQVVSDRQVIRFTYDGLPRVVQPATFGVTTTGKQALRGCLIAGRSKPNYIPCWELYLTDKMVGVEVTGESFAAFRVAGYRMGDSDSMVIIAEH